MKMNKCFLIAWFFLLGIGTTVKAQTKSNLLALCCVTDGRKCSGDESCNACTNCSGCKHCKSGGTCGVCSDGKPDVVRRKEKVKKKGDKVKTVTKTITETPAVKYYKEQPIFVTVASINLRKDPGTDAKILEKVKKGDRVFFLKIKDDWIKVRVEKTGTVGYVHSDNLK